MLRVLARLEHTTFEHYAAAHDFCRYIEPSFKGTVAIDWDNENERNVVMQTLVADCDRVLAVSRTVLARYTPQSEDANEILEATDLLLKIWFIRHLNG